MQTKSYDLETNPVKTPMPRVRKRTRPAEEQVVVPSPAVVKAAPYRTPVTDGVFFKKYGRTRVLAEIGQNPENGKMQTFVMDTKGNPTFVGERDNFHDALTLARSKYKLTPEV